MADSRTFALLMAAAAWLAGIALHINGGLYDPIALAVLTVAIATAAAACLWPQVEWIEKLPRRRVIALLAAGLAVEVVLLWWWSGWTPFVNWGVGALGLVGLAQMLDLRRLRVPLGAGLLALFVVVASVWFLREPTPRIDVLMFQQMSASGLLHGENPYTPRYPNLYERDTRFYGPGVVGPDNRLTVGLPYPPLTLLVTLPAFVLGGDCRFADVAAVAVTAALMFFSRGSQWTGAIAALYLLMPSALYVIEYAWTETIFAATFSLLMFSAIRWRRAVPYALGLFLATKQYSIFALPFLPLLFDGPDRWRSAARALALATLVVAAITLPFFFWDPRAFWRSIVEFQIVQPMRMDALSHLVWIHKYLPWVPLQQAIPFAALAAAIAIVLRRSRPTPAYFAASLAFAQLVFFAFSKQAFANYYYYVIATMWWAPAAAVLAGGVQPVSEVGA